MSNTAPRREIRPGQPRPAPVNDNLQGLAAEGKAVLNRPYAAYIPHGHAHEDHGPASPSALMAAALAGGGPLLAAVFGDMSLGSTPLHSARGGSMPGHPDMGTRMSGPGMAPAFTQGQAPFVSMYPMASPPDTSRSQQGVSMMRHKPPRELSPIKQRAMAFRTNISKSTLWMQPDFKSSSVLAGALDYSLPAKVGAPMLTPALLSDLHQGANQPTGVTSASLMGTYTAPAGATQRLFSNTSKLPFHGASAGALGAPGAGMTQTMLLLAPQLSQAEAHNFDVPPHVKTGMDAVKLFASSAAKEGLIVFCNLNPQAKDYDPYDLVVVDRADVEPSFFYVLTQTGVTHMWGGVAYDLTPHHEWIRDAELFAVLKKLVLFKKRPLFIAFRTWHASVRAIRFAKRQQQLADTLMVLSPTFGTALTHIRRMTLAACEDPAGTWKQRQLGGGRVGWVRAREPLFPEDVNAADEGSSDGDASDDDDGVPQNLVPLGSTVGSPSRPARQTAAAASPGAANQASGSGPDSANPLPQPAPGAASAEASASAGEGAITSPSAQLPASTSLAGPVSSTAAASQPTSPLRTQPSEAMAGSRRQSQSEIGTPRVMAVSEVLTRLLQRGEALPEGGLAAQLGHIGGAQDTYTLAEFCKLRADAKAAVQTSLAQMVQFVVGQVQAVGASVAANLREASAAVARPTKREAREKRFEYMTGKDAWRARSQSLAREADGARMRALAAARWDRDKLPAFLLLADALVLTAMSDLSRLSLATAVHQIFLPRRQGLFFVSGEVQSSLPCQDDDADVQARPASFQPSYMGSMSTTLTTAHNTLRHMDTTISMMSRMSGPCSAAGHRPPVVFVPTAEDLCSALHDVVRDVLAVVAQAALGLGQHPEVRTIMRELLGSTHAMYAATGGAPPGTRGSGSGRDGAVASAGAGGRAGAVIDLLRSSLGAAELVERVGEQVQRQYLAVLRHFNLRPYVGHEAEWALVCAFEPSAYRAANHLPDRLQSDLVSIRTWLEDLAKHRTTSVHVLLHFDMASTRSQLMPQVGKTYADLMASLTTHMMALLRDLMARLSRYIDRLRNRPSELPEFVAHTEATWPHLEENGFKRQRVRFMHEHLGKLYAVIMAAVPKADASPPRRPAPSRPNSAGNSEILEVPEVAVSVKDARPVHMLWKQVQAEVARYHEECVAAADFFQHSSALMTNHLKNSLLQMESDLLQMLHTLRLGASTSVQSKFDDVQAEMAGMERQLVSLGEQQARCTAWAKLLSHVTVMQTLTRSTQLLDAAQAVLVGRQALWRVLHRWEEVCDELYALPCTHHTADGLLVVLEAVLADLEEQVLMLKGLHVSEDVSDTTKATAQESKLAAHYALVVNAWKDMLPYARRLCEPGVKPRHVHILLAWLKVCHTPPDEAHVADVILSERYVVPVVHVSKPLAHVPQPPESVKPRDPFVEAAEEAEHVTFAQLLSRITESPETRSLADRALEVAAQEHKLLGALEAIKARVSKVQVEFSANRTFGAFVITNGPEVMAELQAVDGELGAVRSSPHFGAVMADYELAEQLVSWVTAVMRSALKCQDLWMWLSGLMANSEVVSGAQEAVGAWEALAAVWRKFSLSAKERPSLPQCATVIQEVEVLQEAMGQVINMVAHAVLPSIRTAFPRAYFVPDRVLLEALAVAGDVALLPPALLGACFHGLQGLSVAQDDPSALTLMSPHTHSPLSPTHGSGLPLASPGGASASSGAAAQQPAWGPQDVYAAVGSSGGVMDIVTELTAAPNKSLATFLSELESSLKTSVKVHTKACIEACGNMQADKWVAAFPTQCVVLVDAMVWTQSVTAALTRTAGGERGALRNLCDQSVLRLETLAHQLRVAQAAVSAAEKAQPSGSGRSASLNEASPDMELAAAQQTARGLQALIATGVAHRQVVEGLVSGGVSGPDSFEWLRQVRHYWDADQDILYIAFAQTRLPYGWEYQGGPVDVAPMVLPVSQPGLLSAINALQTSPVVGLSLASGQGSSRATVSAMASLVGKFWVGAELGPDTSSATSARILAGALASDCWLALDGSAGLSLQTLSTLGQQLHSVWAAFYYGTPSISMPGAPIHIPSPWARASQPDAPAPASVFVSLPASVYLVPGHEALLGEAHVGPSQLSETLRRLARVVTLTAPDCSLLLEAGLRCMGLRDAPEGARIVGAVMQLVAMQLPPRPQYRYDVLTVYSLLTFVHGPRPLVAAAPAAAAGAAPVSRAPSAVDRARGDQSGALTNSAVDAIDCALRAVLVGAAEPEDVSLLVRLIDQAVSSSGPRTPAHPDTPVTSVPPAPVRPSMLPIPAPSAAGPAQQGQLPATSTPFGLPSPAELRVALDKLLGSPVKAGVSGAAAGPQGPNTPVRRQASKQVQSASASPEPASAADTTRTVLPLAATNREVLSSAAASLAAMLGVSGTCIVVGRPGIGKSTVWRTLALACATAALSAAPSRSAGAAAAPAAAHLRVAHIYPEALPLPQSVLPGGSSGRDGPGPQGQAAAVVEEWAEVLLDEPPSWQLNQPRWAQLDVLPTPGAGSSALGRVPAVPVGEGGPEWVVFDGPLGTPAAEALVPLLTGRLAHQSSGAASVLGLKQHTKVVWEAASLAAASPLLLSAAPVLCISSNVVDLDGAMVQEGVQAAVRRLVGGNAKATALLSKGPIMLMSAALAGAAPVLMGSRTSGGPAASKPAAASNSNSGTTSTSSSVPPGPGVEHGAVMISTAARGAVSIFSEVVSGLDVPPGASTGSQLLLGRAALFALYWALASLPLETAQRQAVEAAIKEAAATSDMSRALPRGGSIGGYLLGPKAGDWCPWTAALEPIMDTRHGLHNPLAGAGSKHTPGVAAKWHMFTDPLSGEMRFFVPSGVTVALQHVAALVLRAGGHPVVVGSVGSGRATLLRHLLATGTVSAQARTDVVGVTLSPLSQPGELSEMVAWRLTAGAGSRTVRPTLGHKLVILVEDVSAVAQAHAPVEPSLAAAAAGGGGMRAAAAGLPSVGPAGSSPEVVAPCLEWLRQLLDSGSLVGSYGGMYQSVSTQGVSVAATSRVSYFVSGSQQVSPRVWRHLHPLHINAAAAADLASGLQSSTAGGNPIMTTFSRSALLNAVAHYTLLELATGHARIPELLAIGPSGLVEAAKVLSITLEKLMGCVQHLVHAHLLPHAWHFGTAGMLAITGRLRVAAAHVEPGAWRISDVVQRFVFEVGREVANGAADERSKDVLSRVLLHATGRELGALMTGKFELVIRAHSERLAAQAAAAVTSVHPAITPTAAVPATAAPASTMGAALAAGSPASEDAAAKQAGTHATSGPIPSTTPTQPAAAFPSQGLSHPPPPHASRLNGNHAHNHGDSFNELVGLWHSYMSDADGPAMTALRVSLIGKISPSDIDKLLAVVRADLAHMAVVTAQASPAPSGAGVRDAGLTSTGADGSGPRSLAASQSASAASAGGQSAAPTSLLEGGERRWPHWLHHLPVSQEQLPLKVAVLAGISQLPPPLGRRLMSRPASATDGTSGAEDSYAPVAGSTQQGATAQPTGAEAGKRPTSGSSNQGPDAASSITIFVPNVAKHGRRVSYGGRSSSGAGGATLDRVSGELCLNTLAQWEYASTLAAAAHQLVEGFYMGGNLLLSGPDVHTLMHIARLAAISVEAGVMTLECPLPGQLDQVMPNLTAACSRPGVPGVTSLSTAAAARPGSLRHQLLQLLQDIASDVHVPDGGDDDAGDVAGPGSAGDFWLASRFDALSTPDQQQAPAAAATAPQRYVLVIGEEAVADEGVLELLQQLVCWPACATHLHAASASEAATRRFKTQVSRLMLTTKAEAGEDAYGNEDGEVLLGSTNTQPASAAGRGATGALYTSNKAAPKHMNLVIEGLRSLLVSRSFHIRGVSSAFSEFAPGSGLSPRSPRPGEADARQGAAPQSAQQRAIAQAAGLMPTSLPSSSTGKQAPKRNTSQSVLGTMSGRVSYDDVIGLAQTKVDAKRESDEDKARLSQATLQHVLRRLRIVLALSPASAAALRIRYPQLARVLGTVAVAAPSAASQEKAAHSHLQAAAAASTGALLDNSVPPHPEDRVHVVSSMTEEHNEAKQLAARVLNSQEEDQSLPRDPSAADIPAEDPAAAAASMQRGATATGGAHFEDSAAVAPEAASGQQAGRVPVVGSTSGIPQQGGARLADEVAAVKANAQAEAVCEAERASTVLALSKVMVDMHGQAQKLMWQHKLLPAAQPLPHSKVGDVVEVLGRLHAAKRKLLRSQQASLWVALQKLGRSAAAIAHGAADVPALTQAIEVRSRQLEDKRSKLAVVDGYMDQLSAELEAQEQLVARNSAVVAAVTAEVDAALDAAQRRYRQALQEVGGLTENDLAELRSYTNPPDRVRLVMMAVAALFNAPPDWRSAQKLLGEQNPKLLERLVSFDPRSISVMALAKMMRLISEPEFNIVAVAQVSQAAKPLCWWVLSAAELLRVGREADLKRMKIGEAEERLEAATKYVRQLRGELKAARNEAVRLAAARDAADADINEMRALIGDAELAADNVRRLGGVVGRLTQQWEVKLQEVESALPTLLGDATLAAAAVVYLAPLLPSQRAAALSAWHELLQGARVPVSGQFELRAFLGPRERRLLAPIASDVLAGACPAWRESMVLLSAASRPPLLLDAGREASVLVKALHGGRTSQRVFLTIQDESVAEKVAAAVAHGKIVFLDLLQAGEAWQGAGLGVHGSQGADGAAAAAEARVLEQVAVRYEDAMRTLYSNRGTAPHKLYVRLRPGATQLPSLLHGLFTPVLFGYEREQLEGRLSESVLGCLAGQDAVVRLHELVTQQWDVGQAHQEVGESVAFAIAHTRGPVFSDSALVDATAARCGQQDELHTQMGPLQEAIKELSDTARVGQRGLLDAAHTAHDVLQYLAAHDGRATLPDHLFLHLARAAAKSVLAAAAIAYDTDASFAVTPDAQLSARSGVRGSHSGLPSARSAHSGSRRKTGGHASARDRYAHPAALAAQLARLKQQHKAPERAPGGSRVLGDAADSATGANGTSMDMKGSNPDLNGPAAGATGAATGGTDAQDLYLPMLQAMCQLLCACLPSCHAAALRLLLGLQALARPGDITRAELEFTLTLLREGREGVTAATGAVGPAGAATGASNPAQKGPSPLKGPGGSTLGTQPSQLSLFSSLVAISSAASLGDEAPRRTGHEAPPGTAFPSAAQLADLAWLERAFPGAAFQGVRAAVAAAPDAWRAVLWSDDLSRPAAVAAAAAAAAAAARAGLREGSTSLTKTASVLDELRAAMAGVPVAADGSPTGSLLPSTTVGGSATGGAGVPSLVHQASVLQLPRGAGAGGAARPVAGPLPEHWAAARLRSPLHWFLLAALVAPAERLAPAAEWFANVALRAPAPTPTPGERVLVGTLPLPAATPVLLASMGGEDALTAVYAAQAAMSNGVTGALEVPRGSRLGEREVVTHYWDPSHFRDVKSALARAMRHGQWLLLLNAHAAPSCQLLDLLEILSAKEYLLRGDEVAFRVILSLPYAALQSLPPVVRQQGIVVVLEPPTSLACYTRSVVQLLAHPIASYVGYFAKPADHELQVAALGVCLAAGVLGRTLTAAAPPGPPLASPFSWWDILHAVHLVRLVVAEARKYDPGLESHPLDYCRLRELLLADVFLPACPAPHLAPHAAAVVGALVTETALTTDCPIHLLAADRDADAADGAPPPTEPWPFRITGLRDVQSFLTRLMEPPGLGLVTPASLTAPTPAAAAHAAAVPGVGSAVVPELNLTSLATAARGAISGLPGSAGVSAGSSALAAAHGAALPAMQPPFQPQSLAAGGRWPLSLVLRYNSSAHLAASAAASTSLQLHLARCSRPLPSLLPAAADTGTDAGSVYVPGGAEGSGTRRSVPGAAAQAQIHRNSTGAATVSSAQGTRTATPQGAVFSTPRDVHSPALLALLSGGRPSGSGSTTVASARPSACGAAGASRLSASGHAKAVCAPETAPEAVTRVSAASTALMPRGSSSSSTGSSGEVEGCGAASAAGIQSALGDLSAALPILSGLHRWVQGAQAAVARAYAALSARVAQDTAKPRALASSWDTLGAEALAQEGRLLLAALTHAARMLAHLCLVASDPFANGSEASAAAGQLLLRGFVPATWVAALLPAAAAAGAGTLPLQTLAAWQEAVEARTALLCTAAGVPPSPAVPLPAAAPTPAPALPMHLLWAGPLDLGALALPLAPLAVITRAHSAEHCVHIANVVCRVVPAGAAPTVAQQLGGLGLAAGVVPEPGSTGAAGPQAAGHRRGLAVSGLWLRDAGLALIDDAAQGAGAGPSPSDVLQVEDVRAGAPLARCTGLVIVPTAVDPRMRGGASRPVTHSRAGRTTPSAAAAAVAGSSASVLMAPGSQQPLVIPLAVTPWGALAADACGSLQVEARAPFVPGDGGSANLPRAGGSAGGAAGKAGANRGAQGRAAAVSAAAAAAPNARGLCFLVQPAAGSGAAAWAEDRASLAAVAQD